MYQLNQNENKKLREENKELEEKVEKNKMGIERIKKAAHDFSQFSLREKKNA